MSLRPYLERPKHARYTAMSVVPWALVADSGPRTAKAAKKFNTPNSMPMYRKTNRQTKPEIIVAFSFLYTVFNTLHIWKINVYVGNI